MRQKRSWLEVALLLVVVFLAGGCGGSESTFRVATLTWIGYAPLDLALEKGFFEGLNVKLVPIEDTPARRAALLRGDLDASVDIIDSFVNASASGLPAKVVLKLDDSMGGDGIVVRNEISAIEDLRGKSVAYPEGLPSHFFLLALLRDAGMTIQDVESRTMEAGQAGAAFISGTIDAAVTWEPWLSRASETPHGRILTTTREKPGLIVDVLTVREDVLEYRREEVRRFLEGWFRALDFIESHPDEAYEIMARHMGVEKEALVDMVSGVRYADLELNQEYFNVSASGTSEFHEGVALASAIWHQEGLIKREVSPEEIDGSDLVLSLER